MYVIKYRRNLQNAKEGDRSPQSHLSFTVVLWILTTSVCGVRKPNQKCFATDSGYLTKLRTWVLFWSKLAEFRATVFYWISLSRLVSTQPYEHEVCRINVYSVCMLCLQFAGKARAWVVTSGACLHTCFNCTSYRSSCCQGCKYKPGICFTGL